MKYVRGIKHGKKGYLHRLIAEEKIGRELLPNEVVHHLDRNTHNNNPDNLIVMTNDDHINYHRGLLKLEEYGKQKDVLKNDNKFE